MKQEFHEKLKSHLIKADGHCGRNGEEIGNLSHETGFSVHSIQSYAMNRREPDKHRVAALLAAMKRKK